MTEISVNASYLEAAYLFAEKTGPRYYLFGVHIEPAPKPEKGVIITATEGNKMISIHDPHGEISGENQIIKITPDMLPELKKKKGEVKNRVFKIKNNESYVLTDEGLRIDLKKNPENDPEKFFIDGTFPDWKRTLPENLNALTSANLRSGGIETFIKALKTATGQKNPEITLAGVQGGPILLRSEAEKNLIGILFQTGVKKIQIPKVFKRNAD